MEETLKTLAIILVTSVAGYGIYLVLKMLFISLKKDLQKLKKLDRDEWI